MRCGRLTARIWVSPPPVLLPTTVTSSSSSASSESAIKSASAGGAVRVLGHRLQMRAKRQVERHALEAIEARTTLRQNSR